MFDESSRYAKQKTVEVELANGRVAQAVSLRRIPPTEGVITEVKGGDRLDIMALRKYKNSAKFWHIADANTEVEANDLVQAEPVENPLVPPAARTIFVPEK